jgi:multiple sugar transport system substrate-binding protein
MMSEKERRDFDAGLSREVDAWLRGDTSRRTFLTRLVQLGGLGVLSGSMMQVPGWAQAAVQLAQAQMADPGTPLGQAQAAALKASTEGPTDGSAYRAVQAAKAHKGVALNMTYETGLQALEPRNYSGPLWQQLTGITSNVTELSHPDQYSKPIAEHFAGSGAYDILDIEPAWVPSFAEGGVIAPIDDFLKKHSNPADQADYHPLYQAMTTYKGKTWGFFDDGDVFQLYYRKDVFDDQKLKDAYKAKFNQDLRVPQGWDEYAQVAQFITDQMAPNIYGAVHFRKFGDPGNQYSFLQEFRSNGGVFFDEGSMRAQLASDAGVKTLQQMIAQNKASIPGNNEMGAVAAWVAWLQGKVAMIFSWPPTGRMSAGYSQSDKAINFVPKSSIAGKVGYAVMPGKNGEHASGYVKALAADSPNAEAAYLFMQWTTCPAVSLVRVMVPYALRDPYRLSHFTSPLYRALWPDAKDYLIGLNNAANNAVIDLIMPGWQDYALSVDRMCSSVWAGDDPKAALQKAAAEWDTATDKLGADKQRDAYQQFKKLPGASADNTIEKMGKAVTLE